MNEFKDAVAGAEDLVTDAAHSASREYAMARRNIQGAFDEAISRLDGARRAVRTGALDAADATDGYVRRNPWQALGTAAAAGVFLGLFLRRR
jgi:ElaB/YqjD/DUF883 family membrane-anchored ribosome-binding protein